MKKLTILVCAFALMSGAALADWGGVGGRGGWLVGGSGGHGGWLVGLRALRGSGGNGGLLGSYNTGYYNVSNSGSQNIGLFGAHQGHLINPMNLMGGFGQ